MAKKDTVLFPESGVLTREGDPAFAVPILRVAGPPEGGEGALTVTTADNKKLEYNSNQISQDATTGRLEFVSDGTRYRVRELREDDGQWLSKLKISLPQEALTGLFKQGDNMAGPTGRETLTAYALDDSVYIVGLVYTNGVARWSRVDGDWNQFASDDDLFDGCFAMEIDLGQAQKFIDLFDTHYVTVTDTEKYEVDPTDATPEPSQSNIEE